MAVAKSQNSNLESVSIIIPILNEEAQISDTLTCLQEVSAPDVELIIADGGSQDRTVELARAFNFAKVLVCSQANRGRQMNEAAAAASGNVLLFLHADVKLPDNALDSIHHALASKQIFGGCFQIRFPANAPKSLRAVAWGINLRTRLFKTATGDQAIFVRRRAFDDIGGYETFPLMEDIALFNELKRRGKVVVLDEYVEISPRRWLKFGVWQTVLLMYVLRFGYWLGIHPATLKKFFLDVR